MGGGPVAAGKIAGLLADGALVTGRGAGDSAGASISAGVTIHRRPFEPADLDGVVVRGGCGAAGGQPGRCSRRQSVGSCS